MWFVDIMHCHICNCFTCAACSHVWHFIETCCWNLYSKKIMERLICKILSVVWAVWVLSTHPYPFFAVLCSFWRPWIALICCEKAVLRREHMDSMLSSVAFPPNLLSKSVLQKKWAEMLCVAQTQSNVKTIWISALPTRSFPGGIDEYSLWQPWCKKTERQGARHGNTTNGDVGKEMVKGAEFWLQV